MDTATTAIETDTADEANVTIIDDVVVPGEEGLDPRKMTPKQIKALGFVAKPLLAIIRDKCMDCAGSRTEIRLWSSGNCPLWPFRMGTNPFRQREMTEEQRTELVERGRRLSASRKASAPEKSDVAPTAFTVKVDGGSAIVTVKQREAFDILANYPSRIGEIHGKTLGVLTKAGWLADKTLTETGVKVFQALGLTQNENVEAVEPVTARSSTPDALVVVDGEKLTPKQQEAMNTILNHPRKLASIHGKTLGSMVRSGWVEMGTGKPALTDRGMSLATALGLVKNKAA